MNRNFLKYSVSSLTIVALMSPAFAGDLVMMSHEAVETSWAGGYAGVSGGALLPGFDNGWCPGEMNSYYIDDGESVPEGYENWPRDENDSNRLIFEDECRYASLSQETPGMMYGAHLGFNMQDGGLVYGVEADLYLSNLVNVTPYMANPLDQDDSDVSELSIDALASLRGRVGLAFGDTLMTASAGVGYVQAEFAASSDSTDLLSRVNISEVAPVIGLTVEQRVSDSFSLRGGVSHYFVSGSTNVEGLGDGAYDQDVWNNFSNAATWQGVTTVTAGLSFHME